MRKLLLSFVAVALGAALTLQAACGDDEQACSGPQCGGNADAAGAFTLAADAKFPVAQGKSVEIPLTVTRQSYDGPITVTLASPPAGITAAPLTIAAGTNEGRLAVSASEESALGDVPIVIGGADPGGASKQEARTTLVVRGRPGSVDKSFGSGGEVLVPTGMLVAGVAVQSDGRILIGGTLDGEFTAVRLDDRGAIDNGFGTEGRASSKLGDGGAAPANTAYGVTLGPDGTFYVGGLALAPTSRYTVVRFGDSGQLDGTFDGDGMLLSNYPPEPSVQSDLLLLGLMTGPNGGPVFAGAIRRADNSGDRLLIGRFDRAGASVAETDFSAMNLDETARCNIIIGSSTHYVCAGITGTGNGTQTVAYKVAADTLAPEKLFKSGAQDGVVTHSFLEGPSTSAAGLAFESGGIVIGAALRPNRGGIVHFDVNGRETGQSTFDFGEDVEDARVGGMVFDPDGNVVAAASIRETASGRFTLALRRVTKSGAVDPDFGVVKYAPYARRLGATVRIARDALGRLVVVSVVLADDASTAQPQLLVTRYWD